MTTKFVRSIANTFAEEFAEFCASDERMHEVMMLIADDFVQQEAPVLDDETATDVACELIMNVTVSKV